MKHPQVIVFEQEGRLGQLLRPAVEERRWALREPRQLDPCLRLLQADTPTVFVLRVSGKLEQELGLLEQVHGRGPELRTVVVGDVANEALAELAWDLGATFVLFPPQPRALLPDVVVKLMESAIGRQPAGEEQVIADLEKETAALPAKARKKAKKDH